MLLYDGDCAFCRAWVARLRQLDRSGSIAFVPAADRWDIVGLPMVGDDQLDRAMHLVTADGTVLAGARALPEILRYLPRHRWLRLLWGMPGVPWLADRIYSAIARRRHQLGCGSDGCPLGGT